MTAAALLLALVPGPALLLALGLALRGPWRRLTLVAWPWAAVPALALAAGAEVDAERAPGLLLDSWVGLDLVGRVFLLLTALLWTTAGWYARAYLAGDARRVRYVAFHLLTLAGNLGLCIARDLASFYLWFALMTFAGYGLVVHERGPQARRAGTVYVVLAVVGEVLLLAGLMLAGRAAPSLAVEAVARAVAASPQRDLIVGLLLAGFGVKAGAVPLHVWLPLAHPVAPTPASAVLSGAMIKAGLLGWLRFLPLGVVALEGWGVLLIGLGVAAAFFGAALGVMQRDAKTTLAYSSISQMGFMNMAVGIGLAVPRAWPAALAGCLAYVVHHGLAKGALFLGVGVVAGSAARARKLALAGLALPALAIAGAPLTSGSVAKHYLKAAVYEAPGAWPALLDALLPLGALGSALLMARALWLAWQRPPASHGAHGAHGLWAPWAVLLAAVAVVSWWLPGHYELEGARPGLPTGSTLWIAIWPVALAGVLAWLAIWLAAGPARARRVPLHRLRVAPGDLLLPVERLVRHAHRRLRRVSAPTTRTPMVSLGSRWYGVYARDDSAGPLLRGELAITRFRVSGVLLVLVVLAAVGALAWQAR